MSNKLVKERTKKVMSLASQLGTLTSYVKTVVDSSDEANKSLDILDLIRVEVDELNNDKDGFSEFELEIIDKLQSDLTRRVGNVVKYITERRCSVYYVDGLSNDDKGSQAGNSDISGELVKKRTRELMALSAKVKIAENYGRIVDSPDKANKLLDILGAIRIEVDELGKDKDKFSEIEWSFIDKSRSNIIIKIAQAIEFISEGYSKKYYIDGLVDNQGSQDGNSDTTLYYNLMSDKGCSLEAQLAFLEGIVRMLFVMFPGGVPLDKDETIAGNIKEIISNVNVSYDNINQKHGLKKLSGIGSVGSICDDRWDPLSRCKVTLS